MKNIGKLPTDDQLRGCLKESVIPIKFCYPDGGETWHRLRRNDHYDLGGREITALQDGLPWLEEIVEAGANIVHLGPGDGIELQFLPKPKKQSIYAGVDISRAMIQNTLELNPGYFRGINPLWYLTDIEASGNLKLVCDDVKRQGLSKNLILLMGQGVLLSNPLTLSNIYEAMDNGDYLFITIEGDDPDKRQEILKTYDWDWMRALLSIGLRRAGYDPKKGKFLTKFNEAESRVEVNFIPDGGDPILCQASYKPKEKEFRKRLEGSGFNILHLYYNKDSHTFALLCRKRDFR